MFAVRHSPIRHSSLPFSLRAHHWAILTFILLAGASLRLWQVGRVPPGLYQDEAFYGIDAAQVAQDALQLKLQLQLPQLYFPANNGREPLYIYLVALSVGAFGNTPFAERLPSAFVGIALIAATYALGRELFSRRVGVLGAAILAGLFWAVALSRIGFRVGTLPLITALSVAAATRGWRKNNWRWMVLGGALYGLSAYTYLAARFTPLAVLVFVVLWYFFRRETFPKWQMLAAFFIPAAVVAAPFAWLTFTQFDLVFGRAGQVSIFNQSDVWGALARNVLDTLGMFTWRGDGIARHNLPGRPVFDVALSPWFLLGVGLMAWRAVAKRNGASALVWVWASVMLLPTLLASEAPHFLRAVGVLPWIVFFPALAVAEAWKWWEGRWSFVSSRVLVAVIIALQFIITARDYFIRYAPDPNTAYFFQSAALTLGDDINATLDEGHAVYLDQRLWDQFPSLWFVLSDRARLHIQPQPPALALGDVAYVWPLTDWHSAFTQAVQLTAGPLARGDVEPEPYGLYDRYQVVAPLTVAPLAQFAGGPNLVSATLNAQTLTLIWEAPTPLARDWQVFAGAFAEGVLIAQADGVLGTGAFPSRYWAAGQQVHETRVFVLSSDVNWEAVTTIQIGVYDWPSLQRSPRTDAPGAVWELVIK